VTKITEKRLRQRVTLMLRLTPKDLRNPTIVAALNKAISLAKADGVVK
jgi:hypothetical protein